LYPWANRLSTNNYEVKGGEVTLRADVGGVRTDPNGLPIHGVLGAYPGWRVTGQTTNRLTAEVDFGGTPGLLASFPFPHTVQLEAELNERTLTISTTVIATATVPVPLCFGFHPYLALPGIPRSIWVLETPRLRHLLVDDKGIPTGVSEISPASAEPLGERALDDGFDQVPDGAMFVLRGGDRRIEVRFAQGYPAAQLFAPVAEDLIAIEPMAAPTNALRTGNYQVATPGEPATAIFSIRVC
jgi:galactose mutarotase-like enzyme